MAEIPGHVARPWRPSPFLQLSAAVHAGALAGALASPEHWPLAIGVVLANHVSLAGVGMWPRSQLFGPNLTRLPTGERTVALTFDDGPDPTVTPQVLELLAEAEARATFFCVGSRAQQHPDIVSEIVARGHRLENHSFLHSNGFALLGPRALAHEIDRTQEVLTELGGRRPIYFRAPAGIRSPWLEPLLARRGLTLASWTRRGYDAVDTDPERISRRLLQGLSAGDILVMHDGSMISGRDRGDTVVEVLRRVLAALATAGLTGVALPDRGGPE